MVLPVPYVKQARELARALRAVADQLEKLATVKPPADRRPTAHPELGQAARASYRIAETLRKAVAAGYMTAAQYASIARHAERNAQAFQKGAAKELANSRRRSR